MKATFRLAGPALLCILAGWSAWGPSPLVRDVLVAEESAENERAVSYYKQIRPILQARCHGCHQPAKAGGEYVMTSFDRLLQGGETEEPAILPHDPDESNLLLMITPDESGTFEMPRGQGAKPLAAAEIELIREWIAQGAADDTPANTRRRFTAADPPTYSRPPVITSLDYSPDGRLLAVSGFHEVLLHAADGSGPVGRLIGLSERIESVAFSPDGRRLAVTGGSPGRMGELQIWDVEKRELILSVAVTFDTTYGVSWSPDGELVALGCGDTSLRVFRSATGEQVAYMAAHDDWVRGTVFSADGKSVFTVSRDKTVKMTDVATERFVGNVTTHTPGILLGGMNAIDRHPSRPELLAGGADGAPKLFKMDVQAAPAGGGNPNQIREYGRLPGRVFDVCFQSGTGAVAFAGSSLDGAGQVRAFETDSGKELWMRDIPQGGVFALACSPDGKTLAVAGADGAIRLLEVADGSVRREFSPIEADQGSQERQGVADASMDIPELTGQEAIPDGFRVRGISATPEQVEVSSPGDYVQLLITAGLNDGAHADVTRLVRWSISGDLGKVSPRGVFTPRHDGSGTLTAEVDGFRVEVPVTVSGMDRDFRPDYVRDVNPAISKLGCNAGTCHGSKDGKNGFKLSLRGYDALFDVRSFTDDMASRRVNVASPDLSLMLLKATGAVPHEGGQVTPHDSKYYRIVRDWIAGGARLDRDSPRVTDIEIQPTNPVVQRIGGSQQMRILATYEDGSRRDVTLESHVTSGNTEIATHDDHGLLTSVRRGESPVLARFEGRYAATTLTVMGDRSGFVWRQPPANNEIDELVAEKWRRMKIQPSELCSDDQFVRRVYLDLTGLPPSVDEVRRFLADERPTQIKRDELVDRLVGSEAFIELWTNKWADLLQVNRKFLGEQGAKPFREWIRKEVAENTPYDRFVREILTATGSNKDNPPASYFKILRTPEDTMENTTHLFLATRFNCNKCHDHPFERWTQDQYYQLAAYFARFELKKDPASGKNEIGRTAVESGKPLYEIVEDVKTGEVKHERTGENTPPEFPYPVEYEAEDDASRRARLAAWITSPENPYFARSYVNRLWGYLLGTGIIDPIDDIRAGNPPTNPALLDWLTREFVDSGFDARHMFRRICKSRTYQLSVETNAWNADDTINFSHFIPRRLPAEVLLDSIHKVTGATSNFPGVPPGTRAAELPDAGVTLPDGFLDNFGRPARESACECERQNGLQLGPVMALMSGPTVNDAISNPNSAIAQLAKSEMDDRALVEKLVLRILNRPPSEQEIQAGLEAIRTLVDADHQTLAERVEAYERELAPVIAAKEKERERLIAAAREALSLYERQVAEREAELDRRHAERIAEAQRDLDTFDKQLPERMSAWLTRVADGTYGWTVLDPKSAIASNGASLQRQDDLSILASGQNGKTTYDVRAETDRAGITGVRVELLADERLPGKGPGRADNGNFVLTELEVHASPARNLDAWKNVADWDAEALNRDWTTRDGATAQVEQDHLRVAGTATTGEISLGPWHSVGPFFQADAFDKVFGPEGHPVDLQQEFPSDGETLRWQPRNELKDGEVFNFEPGQNCVNYFYRKIVASGNRELALNLGSDDGIKVWVNGQPALSKDIGRAAAADQETVRAVLRAGDNHLLVKIHNQGGPSGIYFSADAAVAARPALATDVSSPAGSFVLELAAEADAPQQARLYWTTDKEKSYSDKRVSEPAAISTQWQTHRFAFATTDALAGLRLEPGEGSIRIKDARLYGNGPPRTLKLRNAKADFSQGGYDVSTAIDGQTAEAGNGWASAPKLGENRVASFETTEDLGYNGGTNLRFVLNQQFQDGKHTIGRFRLAVTSEPRPLDFGLPEEVERILAVDADKRNDEQRQKLLEHYTTIDPERRALSAALAAARQPRPVDPELERLRDRLATAEQPVPKSDAALDRLRRDYEISKQQLEQKRVTAAQDIAWALINSPSFLFNR